MLVSFYCCVNFYLAAYRPTVHAEKVSKTDQKSTRPVKTPKLKDLIDAEFEKEVRKFIESEQQLQIGDLVMARMKGYAPWPGRVEKFSSNTKIVTCFFFWHTQLRSSGLKKYHTVHFRIRNSAFGLFAPTIHT